MSDTTQHSQEAARALADDHSEVDKLLNKLLAALAQEDTAKSFELLDLLWARLAVHIRAEHLCLFPSILKAPHDEAKSAIDLLRHDHDFFMRELGAAVNTMCKLGTRSDHDVISKRLRDVRHSVVKIQSRLDTHNQFEENHVYKWVNVLLGEAKSSTLMARITHELENIPARFKG